MSRAVRVSTRNASFQQWQALLSNRTKRHRAREFLVQGVRPISLALDHGWEIRDLIYPDRQSLSAWARDVIERSGARRVAMDPALVAELADKESAELIAVVGLPDPPELPDADLVVVFDRPSTPGNIGTLIRSADAFGAAAVVITGHAADPYDPKSVRASTGSIFALPVIPLDGPGPLLDWAAATGAQLVGTDEHGAVDVADHDLTGPTALLIGSEASGLSAAWRDAADVLVRIPITGAASSLNAATAATVVLYETQRQRSS
ncbi:rRNA methyltransferase [Actinoplanes bogorensis]|uniref:rRNA methyltransferase n=1 Tax=Paractinoplanes bogorensis TaxID=1610840 RepID=A0ABS5YGE6_9ACTN|nr:TrmH family RNA methyltransferase [Actinoplanes bogorensis]MBU2662440.1 rRNA methyltransferase [Actinoplanes bogorensis]